MEVRVPSDRGWRTWRTWSGVISATPLPPSCLLFIIPKSSEKVCLILSCLGMNDRIGDPPMFQLSSGEGIAQLLAATPRSRRLFCTHVDVTNAFWSSRLPPQMREAFRFRDRPGGQVLALDRLPFGWKFSPIFCQRILGDLVRPMVPPPPWRCYKISSMPPPPKPQKVPGYPPISP